MVILAEDKIGVSAGVIQRYYKKLRLRVRGRDFVI